MHWIRSTWGMRLVAAVLLVGMLPAFLAPMYWANRYHHAYSYADWLQGQLADPADEDVQYALKEAMDADPASLKVFLQTFLAALPAERAQSMLGVAGEPSSEEVIVDLLQHRFLRLIGNAILPSAYLVKSTLPQATVSTDRLVSASAAWVQQVLRYQHGFLAQEHAGASLQLFWPVRMRTQAQPMGP